MRACWAAAREEALARGFLCGLGCVLSPHGFLRAVLFSSVFGARSVRGYSLHDRVAQKLHATNYLSPTRAKTFPERCNLQCTIGCRDCLRFLFRAFSVACSPNCASKLRREKCSRSLVFPRTHQAQCRQRAQPSTLFTRHPCRRRHLATTRRRTRYADPSSSAPAFSSTTSASPPSSPPAPGLTTCARSPAR